jgi:hypothetical protein
MEGEGGVKKKKSSVGLGLSVADVEVKQANLTF